MATDGVTIYDIAARAKVSIATVSRAFNDNPRVSPQTRAKIFAIANDLGYQPNASAQNLAKRRSTLVSAVIPMMTSYFYLEVLQGVQDRIASSGFDLLVYSAPRLEDVDGLLNNALRRGKSAGILLFSSPLDAARIAFLKKRPQHIVLVDQFHEGFDSVSIDNEQGGYMATEYLLQSGYARIGLIQASVASLPSQKRAEGYRRAHEAYGVEVDERLMVGEGDAQFHGFTEEAGYASMQALLSLDVPPEVVFAVSDIQALGAKRAMEDKGLKIPEDVGLMGFDDIMISRYVGLSTLRQPMYEMGKTATDLLLKRIAVPDCPISHTLYSPTLIQRTTCMNHTLNNA